MELRVDRSANRIRQTWIANGEPKYYERYMNPAVSTWSSWYKFEGTEITT